MKLTAATRNAASKEATLFFQRHSPDEEISQKMRKRLGAVKDANTLKARVSALLEVGWHAGRHSMKKTVAKVIDGDDDCYAMFCPYCGHHWSEHLDGRCSAPANESRRREDD